VGLALPVLNVLKLWGYDSRRLESESVAKKRPAGAAFFISKQAWSVPRGHRPPQPKRVYAQLDGVSSRNLAPDDVGVPAGKGGAASCNH